MNENKKKPNIKKQNRDDISKSKINTIHKINQTDINITNYINIYKKSIKNYLQVLVDIQKIKHYASIQVMDSYESILADNFKKKWIRFLALTCHATILKLDDNIDIEFYCKKHQNFYGPYMIDTTHIFSPYQISPYQITPYLSDTSNIMNNSEIIILSINNNIKKKINKHFYNCNGMIFFNPNLLLDHMYSLHFGPRSCIMTPNEVISFLNIYPNIEFVDKYYLFIENIINRIKPFE